MVWRIVSLTFVFTCILAEQEFPVLFKYIENHSQVPQENQQFDTNHRPYSHQVQDAVTNSPNQNKFLLRAPESEPKHVNLEVHRARNIQVQDSVTKSLDQNQFLMRAPERDLKHVNREVQRARKVQVQDAVTNSPDEQKAETMAPDRDPRRLNVETQPYEKFSMKLFQIVGPSHIQTNVIYSPISLQTLLAFIFTGAQGETSEELQTALELPENKFNIVGNMFRNMLNTEFNSSKAILVMANKMYYSSTLSTQPRFRWSGHNFFNSETEAVSFSSPNLVAERINRWVAEKTEDRIRDLISPNALDAQTSAVLVNAIYFKALWSRSFSAYNTRERDFHINENQNVSANMMYDDSEYRYAEVAELDAKVLEMPYLDSNISMMLILPNQVGGLAALERNLNGTLLNRLAEKLTTQQSVIVEVPRFKINFELDMVETLKKMGIRKLFTASADLGGLFKENTGVAKVQHKAYIEVNEAGSEAAAASYASVMPLSLPDKQYYFTADHPFVFAIRSPCTVYFIGHVVRP